MQIAERRDARRLAAAVAAAILVHAGMVFAIPFLTSLDTASLPDYGPIVVTLEEPLVALEPPAPQPAPKIVPAPKPEPTAPVAAAKPSPAPVPAKPAAAAAASATAPQEPHQSFKKAGGLTGTSAGPATEPANMPNINLPRDLSTHSTPGSGDQRSGEAVATGAKPAGSGGSITSAITNADSSIARAATTGPTGAAAPPAGTTGGTAATGANIEWENPDAAKGRELLSWPNPQLPDTVKRTGFSLTLRVAFTVNAEGLVTSYRVVQGSGDAKVDAACLDALKKAKFTPAKGSVELNGSRTIRITLR